MSEELLEIKTRLNHIHTYILEVKEKVVSLEQKIVQLEQRVEKLEKRLNNFKPLNWERLLWWILIALAIILNRPEIVQLLQQLK